MRTHQPALTIYYGQCSAMAMFHLVLIKDAIHLELRLLQPDSNYLVIGALLSYSMSYCL
jgi:hypothetical protein